MKRIVFLTLLLAPLIGFSQLSGNYTINQTLPSSASNFNSLTDFNNRLKLLGIEDSIIVTIQPATGPYIGRIVLDSVVKNTPGDYIRITGGGNTIYDTSSAITEPLVHIRKTSNVEILELTIDALYGNNFAEVLLIEEESRNIEIVACTLFQDTASGPQKNNIQIGKRINENSQSSCGNISIINNYISGGIDAISIAGDTSIAIYPNKIINNTITDFNQYGIISTESVNDEYSSNNIFKYEGTSFKGIYCIKGKGLTIKSNRINFNTSNGQISLQYGIQLKNSRTNATSPIRIYNNVIGGNSKSDYSYGIELLESDYTEIHFNTIYIVKETRNSGMEGVRVEYQYANTIAYGVNISNNIIYLKKRTQGNSFCLYFFKSLSGISSNNNILFNRPLNWILTYTGFWQSNYNSLKSWQTADNGAFDQESDSLNPDFIYAELDSLMPNSTAINDSGTFIPWITTDFYGRPRGSNPDQGAIEFTPIQKNLKIDQDTIFSHCSGRVNIPFKVYNLGTDTIQNFIFNWRINNGLTNSKSISSAIPSGDSITVYVDSVINRTNLTIEAWVDYPNGVADEFIMNDTVVKFVSVQLSGYYTINSALPQDTNNFTSYSDATEFLTKYGVCGPVVFEVIKGSGPYKEEVFLGSIKGSDSTNTVTFKGSLDTLQLSDTSKTGAILFQIRDSKFVRFDSVIFFMPGNVLGTGIEISGDCENIIIENCSIILKYVQGAKYTNSYRCMMLKAITTLSTAKPREIVIRNNIFEGGSDGLIINSNNWDSIPENIVIESNYFSQFLRFGLFVNSTINTRIINNEIFQDSIPIPHRFVGIGGWRNTELTILKNYIHGVKNEQLCINSIGMEIDQTLGNINQENIIANNIIRDIPSSGNVLGIYYSGEYGRLYHNTIRLNQRKEVPSGILGVYLDYSTENKFMNNLIEISSPFSHVTRIFYFRDTNQTYVSDFNALYYDVSDTNLLSLGEYGGIKYDSLANWQNVPGKNYDINSVFSNPLFFDTDFLPKSPAIDDIGSPLGILDDFYGNPRSTTNPDPGAIEFTADSVNLSVDSIPGGLFGNCGESEQPLQAFVTNYGSQTLYNAPVYFDLIDSSGSRLFSANIDSISSLSSILFSIDTAEITSNGVHQLTCYSAVAGDQYLLNDTVADETLFLIKRPKAIFIDDTVVCGNYPFEIQSGNGIDTLWWYLNNTATVPFTTGPVIKFNSLNSPTRIYVEPKAESLSCRAERTSFLIEPEVLEVDFSIKKQSTDKSYEFIPVINGFAYNLYYDFGDGNDTSLSAIDTVVHQYQSFGIYEVIAIVEGRCDTVSTSKELNVRTIGIEKLPEAKFIVYPNPAGDRINLYSLQNNYSYYLTIEIYDMSGTLVFHKMNHSPKIDIETLTIGTYMIRILDNSGMMLHQQKFVKKE